MDTYELVHIHIPGHQPEMKRMTTEEARKHRERVNRARAEIIALGKLVLEDQKKHQSQYLNGLK